MRPIPPEMPSSYSGRQKPRQTAAQESRSTHPSVLEAPAAPLVAGTAYGAIHPPWLSRWRSDVFLPVDPRPARVFVLHPRACSVIRASTHPSCGWLLSRRTGSLPSPSIPLSCCPLSPPAHCPAPPP